MRQSVIYEEGRIREGEGDVWLYLFTPKVRKDFSWVFGYTLFVAFAAVGTWIFGTFRP